VVGNGYHTESDTPTPARTVETAGPSPTPVAARDGAAQTVPAGIDPHAFVALDGPAFEPCSACGTRPSFNRETWRKGMTERRVLCRRCYDAAVRRAQAAVEAGDDALAPAEREQEAIGARNDAPGRAGDALRPDLGRDHQSPNCRRPSSRNAGEIRAHGAMPTMHEKGLQSNPSLSI
jgi:hypothetical protein